jgi:hypothetical protein
MTRKDYILIAETLRQLLDDIARQGDSLERVGLSDRTRAVIHGEHLGVRHAALRLADVLRQDNPRFDRTRFIEACGLTA